MTTKKILVPCDFSPRSDMAFEYAATLAHELGAGLIIAHVQELPIVYGESSYHDGLSEPDANEVRRMLYDVKPMDRDVAVEHRLLAGDPGVRIAALAKEEGADLIVMGSHGRSGPGRVGLGSVAESVLRRADCPVLIVRPVTTVDRVFADAGAAGRSID